MKMLYINRIYSEKFAKKYVPNIYVSMLKDAFNNKKYTAIISKAAEKFNITKNDILAAIKIENIIVSQLEDNYVIHFNDVLIRNKISLEQVLDYINDGDLSFKGYNIVNQIINYINTNIRTIHSYYLLKGD